MNTGVLNANLSNQNSPILNTSNNNIIAVVPCAFTANSIRKRKVKFTIQFDIEELLSVPYVNGVLFCKVRLCDGGNHVSYSSKKEVNNSKVLWSNDPSIQFDVKAVQLYSLRTSSSNLEKEDQKCVIIGYEPCFCRISVRKELRGGKSYQKLGYVDYNLSDFILKYQQCEQSTSEFCVNRILKEYDNTSKKNQQRLDNSYLKIKIKIIEMNNQNKFEQLTKSVQNLENEQKEMSSSSSESPSINKIDSNKDIPVSFICGNIQSQSMTNTSQKNPIHTHTRNLSLTSNLGLIGSNNGNSNCYSMSGQVVNQHYNSYGHNRSCSNGSIKSNISFDFLIKNRNNKLMEDIHTTSSTSSFGNSGLILNSQSTSFSILTSNLKQEMISSSNSSSFLSNNGKNSFANSSSSTSSIPIVNNNNNQINLLGNNTNTNNSSQQNTLFNNRLEPANLRIIETRVDANEIIREIENELSNRLLNNKVFS
ncbi:unnamed protein product [Brachionus calyciflorus]|uniref:C2 NT-type domain-containing protein n=1 Tax=Brachionus calyciflorus TaxID=104777 RepID=A0A814CD85_9BILA|nr:unnamed protein product [Brachionus calyciflorus]